MKGNKVVLVGETGVGKTSLIHTYIKGYFSTSVDSTIGAGFFSTKVDDVRLDIWDTAGQERFNSMISLYTRGAKVVLLCFDHVNIDYINKTLKKIERDCPGAVCLFVALKYQEVETDYKQLKHEINYVNSKNGIGVTELFKKIAGSIQPSKEKDDIYALVTRYDYSKSCC